MWAKQVLLLFFTATRLITRRDGCIPYSTYLVNTNISRSQTKCLSSDFDLTGAISFIPKTLICMHPVGFIFIHDHKLGRPLSMNHHHVTHIISHYTVLGYFFVCTVRAFSSIKRDRKLTQNNSMHNKQFCWKVSSRLYLDTLEFSVL